MSELRILFCASEVTPYAKTGGLADVAGALPRALHQMGCDVRIFMPFYRSVRGKIDSVTPLAENLPIPVGIHDFRLHIWEARTSSGIPLYLLEKDELFDRGSLYGTPARGDYEDNAERFVAFCRSVHPLCARLGWYPDILHLHDWQTALVASYYHYFWRYDPNFLHAGVVFTIHNLAYQGKFPASYFSLTHLPPEAFSMDGIEFWGNCNFLKAGLIHSDFLTTVSPRYSREIQQPEFGYGMEGILRERRADLAGILNGVDYTVWSPEADPLIPARYDAADLSGKRACKDGLLSELGFPEEAYDLPLLGIIGRMASQKGFDLLLEAMEELMSLPLNLVILGTGDAEIEQKLEEIADHYPDKLKVLFQFDERLAHGIEAGADIFLMPSHYEPCGLNQMYSLRYGTIPVVYRTGGLDDTVVDVLQYPLTGTGFKFYEYKADPFLYVVRAALELFQNEQSWREIQERAMAQDFSWSRSAGEYLEIYETLFESKRRAKEGSPGMERATPRGVAE
jgi:starch synthase